MKKNKSSQMGIVLALSNKKFRNRAVYYMKINRIVKNNLREILRHKVLTKDEIRYVSSFGRVVYPITIISGILISFYAVVLALIKWL